MKPDNGAHKYQIAKGLSGTTEAPKQLCDPREWVSGVPSEMKRLRQLEEENAKRASALSPICPWTRQRRNDQRQP
jgi:hypothetical protein